MSNAVFTLDEITKKVEDISRRLMQKVNKNSKWEENTITELLCAELRELLGFSGDGNVGRAVKIKNDIFEGTFFVLLDAHKISIKEMEKKNGDVLGLVIFEDDREIKGLGFFFWEAKRVFPSAKLESFKFSQLMNILRYSPCTKYVIYDPKKLAVGVVNPRIFLFHKNTYYANSPQVPVSKIYAYTMDFPNYFCRSLLLGNDLILLTKSFNGHFEYVPFLDFPVENLFPSKEVLNIVNYIIKFFKKSYSVPKYLILQARSTNAEPINAIELMEEIKEYLKKEVGLKPVRRSNDKGYDNTPDDDSGPSMGF